jgi:hypothetical protein
VLSKLSLFEFLALLLCKNSNKKELKCDELWRVAIRNHIELSLIQKILKGDLVHAYILGRFTVVIPTKFRAS